MIVSAVSHSRDLLALVQRKQKDGSKWVIEKVVTLAQAPNLARKEQAPSLCSKV